MIDLHTHSKYSFDTQQEPAEILDLARAAQRAGIRVLAVTDHYDLFRCRAPIQYDIAAVQSDIYMAQQKISKDLKLLRGIELGQPHLNPKITKEIMEQNTFDVVIGSLHAMPNDIDFYDYDYSNIDCDRLLCEYFAEVLRMEEFGGFDVLAHLDYPLRVMKQEGTQPSFDNFMEHILPVLREAVRRGYALECNAATLFSWMGRPGPDRWILEEYRRLGGERITFGSDAHRAIDVGRGWQTYFEYVKSIGFQHITFFESRKPKTFTLEI